MPIVTFHLADAARKAGFTEIMFQGDYAGGKFEPESSWDVVNLIENGAGGFSPPEQKSIN